MCTSIHTYNMYIFLFVHHIINVGIENRTLVSIGSSPCFCHSWTWWCCNSMNITLVHFIIFQSFNIGWWLQTIGKYLDQLHDYISKHLYQHTFMRHMMFIEHLYFCVQALICKHGSQLNLFFPSFVCLCITNWDSYIFHCGFLSMCMYTTPWSIGHSYFMLCSWQYMHRDTWCNASIAHEFDLHVLGK
jgi:hypothetical protein